MKAKLINEQYGQKTIALVFDKDEEFISKLKEFATGQKLTASHFTAIGAFSEVTFGYFDRATMDYREIPFKEQVEVLSLVGNIAINEGKPKIHAHGVIGKADATTRGGHILEARVWPTLEVIVVESPQHLQRHTDEETGLALIDLSAAPYEKTHV
ncbi:MAG TPA: DNA-binding protein [Anaerolineae bacterium]|nr:DNA-binding protein [Anaerolineae bacterium]HMR65735.1 DNA-binding protein [Anaerolineae bacterium]